MLAGISGILKVGVFLNFANLILNIFTNCILTKKTKQSKTVYIKLKEKASQRKKRDLLKEKNKEERKTFALIMGLKLLR